MECGGVRPDGAARPEGGKQRLERKPDAKPGQPQWPSRVKAPPQDRPRPRLLRLLGARLCWLWVARHLQRREDGPLRA